MAPDNGLIRHVQAWVNEGSLPWLIMGWLSFIIMGTNGLINLLLDT